MNYTFNSLTAIMWDCKISLFDVQSFLLLLCDFYWVFSALGSQNEGMTYDMMIYIVFCRRHSHTDLQCQEHKWWQNLHFKWTFSVKKVFFFCQKTFLYAGISIYKHTVRTCMNHQKHHTGRSAFAIKLQSILECVQTHLKICWDVNFWFAAPGKGFHMQVCVLIIFE